MTSSLRLFGSGTKNRPEVANEDPDNQSPEQRALQPPFRVTHVSEHGPPLCSVGNVDFLSRF